MDPETRKFMWNKLVQLRDAGCSILISTHVIEEAEALASRVGIMINGQIVEEAPITELI